MADGSYLFYSDFNCPFCFALNERLLAVGDKGRIGWRGIEHMPAADSLQITWEEQVAINNEVSVIRRRAPEIAVTPPKFRPSTGLANRLMATLRAMPEPSPQLPELRTAIYRAYWRDGLDISDLGVLTDLCAGAGVPMPERVDGAQAAADLAEWQTDWEGERFHRRLPAMLAQHNDKPLLGFPTLDFLYRFFTDAELPIAPESLAACELKPKQHVLIVSAQPARINLTELAPAYHIHRAIDAEDAGVVMAQVSCPPDLVLVDLESAGDQGLALMSTLRREPDLRTVPFLALLPQLGADAELAAFDAGATDVVFDLSNQKICQARLEMHLRGRRNAALLGSMARFDYLTELPNRREFDRRLESEWRRALRSKEPLSVALLDIDHFKLYNDSLGHSTGDDCLRQVAAALRQAARRGGDMVARYGGEEFGGILPNTDAKGACGRAQVICDSVFDVGLPHPNSSAAEVVTVSVGVATMVPVEGVAPTVLLQRADEALYRAKDSGRNRHVCWKPPPE
jgi:diguanylate cyclase (GGDEF)-like protein